MIKLEDFMKDPVAGMQELMKMPPEEAQKWIEAQTTRLKMMLAEADKVEKKDEHPAS